jgi:hypothetical protein
MIFVFSGLSNVLYSQISGEIINNEIYRDTLDFGICMVGDNIQKTFKIKNTGNKTLKIGPIKPSFAIETTGLAGHLKDHEEFSDNLGVSRELFVIPGDSATLIIRYKADLDTNTWVFGQKFARLTVGLYDFELNPPTNLNECVASINIILTVGKVRKHIDGYVNSYNFDSVYINPPSPIEYKWKIGNATSGFLQIDSQRVAWRTTPLVPPEYEIESESLPMPLMSGSKLSDWSIKYAPRNRGDDKATLFAYYYFNNKLEFTYVDISGTGVEQDLVVLSSNASGYNKDTIDIGRVWVGQSKEIWALFGNNGNLNFGAEAQYVFDGVEGDFPSENFSIIKAIATNRHFFPTQGDTFSLKFSANKKGKFIARYIIESDISKRKIRGVPGAALTEVFYIKGEGIEPQLLPELDTIDFGNVVWHPDCPTSRTFTLKLRNVGNTDLQLIDVICNPPFAIEYYNNEPIYFIPALSVDSLKVIFTPTNQEKYLSDVIFITNGNPPRDTIKVTLKATKSEPDRVKLAIAKDIKVKPGNVVSVALNVDSELIQKARTFRTELTYNKTILKFLSYDRIGTASENSEANDIEIKELNDGGRLKIYLETPSKGTNFLPRQNLLRLNFATYIGDEISTPVTFIEPLFGDGICEKVLLPLDTNGLITIDSICGLNDLLLPQGYGSFVIGEISPNPIAEDAVLRYSLKYEIPLEISLYNEMGVRLNDYLNANQKAGVYELKISAESLTTGIYYLQFKSGIYSTSRRLVVIK